MDAQKEIKIQPFSDSEYSRLLKLTHSTYKGSEIADSAYLKWEYEDNPAGKAILEVAQAEDQLVAQYLVLPRMFSVFGATVMGSLSVNSLTHPDYRGQGLFGKLANAVYERCSKNGCQFTVGMPNPVSYPLFVSKLNFANPGRIPFRILPLRPLSMIRKRLSGHKKKHGAEFGLKKAMQLSQFGNGRELLSFSPQEDQDLLETFIAEWEKHHPLAVKRSAAYMHWRYVSVPNRQYHLCIVRHYGKIEALMVVRMKEVFGWSCAIIMDFLVLPGKEGIISGTGLLEFLKKSAYESGADAILCAMTAGQEANLLRQKGFKTVPDFLLPQKLEFILRLHKEFPNSATLKNWENWHFCFGDYDVF